MGKKIQTLAALGLIKTALILFNTAFWISGLFFFSLGLWMEFKLEKYMDLSPYLISSLPLMLIGLGASIFLFAMFACCCTFKGKVTLLYMYFSFLLVVFIFESSLLMCGYFFREILDNSLHKGLARGLQIYGKESTRSSAIDDMQSTLQCCGLSNYTDWQATPWGKGHPNKLPHSCCLSTVEAVCTDNKEKAMLHRRGCYRLIVNFIIEHRNKLDMAILVVTLGHLFGLMLTCLLTRVIKKSDYQEIL